MACLVTLAVMEGETEPRDPFLVSGGVLAGLVGVGIIGLFGLGGRGTADTKD